MAGTDVVSQLNRNTCEIRNLRKRVVCGTGDIHTDNIDANTLRVREINIGDATTTLTDGLMVKEDGDLTFSASLLEFVGTLSGIGYSGEDTDYIAGVNLSYDRGIVTTLSFDLLEPTGVGIRIGEDVGLGQAIETIAIGFGAGLSNQDLRSIAIGVDAGSLDQGSQSIAIGYDTGISSQGNGAIAIGRSAGEIRQTGEALAIGYQAGLSSQGSRGIALGYQAGMYDQGNTTIAIGQQAGLSNQSINTVAIGSLTARTSQGAQSIAIGRFAGDVTQGVDSVAIGHLAARENQGTGSIAIGQSAGVSNQGDYCVAIGYAAGGNDQDDNTIVINATGATLNTGNTGATYIRPIRTYNAGGTLQSLVYNQVTSEIICDTNGAKTFVIDHPLDRDSYLVHACLEGPEAGVYYRGKAAIAEGQDNTTVVLPDYVDSIATDFTVTLTPIGQPRLLGASEVEAGSFKVYGPPGPFHWHVYGQRLPVQTKVAKNSATLHANGPYTWIE